MEYTTSLLTSREDLADAAPEHVIQRTLAAAREILEMDMTYVADTRAGLQAYTAVEGDAESFGASAGDAIPLEGTYCRAMLAGTLPNVVNDSGAHPATRDLAITADAEIGAYIGVPLVFSDGRLYGTFCCLSHEPEPELQERDVKLMEVLGRLIADQLEAEERRAEEQRRAVVGGRVQALLAALGARDGYTEAHSSAVVELALAVAREMGLSEASLEDVEQAAVLHDIGKIGVSDRVLRKPGPLDDDEWDEMRLHPEIGERIVASMPGLAHLAPVIRAEHERWDGDGYPDGLTADQIPLASRIVLVCDAYHAMTSDRPYRAALGHEAAVEEIRKGAGSQFCPEAVDAALRVLTSPA
jgi:response regulator RpfG family c-di-GMP phosphodiesterase